MSGEKTIGLVGLGLIGGSLAASLKARGDGWTVRALDRRRGALGHAVANGYIDQACESLGEVVRDADLVVLATPVGAIRSSLCEVVALLKPGQVLTDVGSTKTTIVATARECVPDGVGFVGGHPIAGTERAGVENAVPGLFEGRTCILTPDAKTSREALEAVTALWVEVGAEVVYLDPETHDRTFALLSHLPHVAAYSLINAVAPELAEGRSHLAGGALRDITRVAVSPPGVWRDICLENRDAILGALDTFEARLDEVRAAIASGDGEALESMFRRAASARGIPWTR